MEELTKQLIQKAQRSNEWTLGNSVLYKLCEDHPRHTNEEDIVSKIWLIGRTYAASIERRKNTNQDSIPNDEFYKNIVANKILRANVDEYLNKLPKGNNKNTNLDNLEDILSAHYKITQLFYEITELKKRSLASKYLHFHFPNLFFIYDSRAKNALSKLTKSKIKKNQYKEADSVYAKFCQDAIMLRTTIEKNYNIFLTPRELDNLLLSISHASIPTNQ